MKRRHRVLHVIDSLDLGGAQAVLLNLLRHGDRTRFEFEAACLHGHGVYWEQLRALGLPVRSLSFHHYFPSYAAAIVWLCVSRRYEVVHTHLLASNLIAKPLAAFCGVPVRINHDHCNDKLADPRRWVPKADEITNRWSTHIIAVSQSTREYLEKAEHVASQRVTTIHNGVDLKVYRPRPEHRIKARQQWRLPVEAFVIAGIGRLTYQKNFSLFLKVAAQVKERQPHACFVIAGTGDEELALKEQARELGIADAVHFLGYVRDMADLYPAMDMLLLTSRYEGLPITILEAMAMGLPIVSAKLDGVQEILVDDVDAALVPPGDAGGFVESVCKLIAYPELQLRYVDAARAKVQTEYSAEAMTRAVESVYLRYLEGDG